jgi:hypothetical protein
MWSFCVTSLPAAPCLPQWICLTFAWDDDDEPDEQALTFCALQVQSMQEMFAFLFPYVNYMPKNNCPFGTNRKLFFELLVSLDPVLQEDSSLDCSGLFSVAQLILQ